MKNEPEINQNKKKNKNKSNNDVPSEKILEKNLIQAEVLKKLLEKNKIEKHK